MIQPSFPASRRSFPNGNICAFGSSCAFCLNAPSVLAGILTVTARLEKSGANSKPIHLATLDLVHLALATLNPAAVKKSNTPSKLRRGSSMYVLIRPAAWPDQQEPTSIACAALQRAAATLHHVSGAPFEPNPIRLMSAMFWSDPEGEGGAASKQFFSSSGCTSTWQYASEKSHVTFSQETPASDVKFKEAASENNSSQSATTSRGRGKVGRSGTGARVFALERLISSTRRSLRSSGNLFT